MTMKIAGLTIGLLLAGAAHAAAVERPAPLPPRPVTDILFGTQVRDDYRYFEGSDPAVAEWMKAQGRYTRAVLDSIPGHAALLARVSAFTGSFDLVQSVQVAGARTFYQDRAPGSDNFDLLVREGDGRTRKLVDVAALRAAHGGTPYAINYFLASPDGSKVAVGVSAGGSEDAAITVYDVASGKALTDALPRAQFGVSGWSDDGRLLFVNQLAALPPGAAETEKYQNSVAEVWDLHSAPVPLVSSRIPGPIQAPPAMFPLVAPVHGASIAFAALINGTQNEHALWTAPASAAARPGAPWTKFADFDDAITGTDVSGDRIFLLSHKDAPTFKVLTLRAGQPLSAATVMVAAQPGRLIENIGAASDGLYIRSRRGLYSELTRVPLGGGPEETIALPARGSIGEMFTDPTQPGATLILESWALPPATFRYDPAARRFARLDIGHNPPSFDPRAFAVSDLHATARDGTAVPLSFVDAARAAKRPKPVLLWAYGSYGISEFPYFSSRFALALDNGIAVAVCHVRGGGELGEAWRLGGKDANKPNTWRDLIACGETLVKNGSVTPKQLFIMGGSAGGITMGRAMEERPDLFAGVLDLVPAANATRQEFSPNGVPNIPEFGTVKTEAGFRNLLAMDTVVNVKAGVAYPPIMITTGLNDPRVASWEPAKLAARLMAAGPTPVLLRIDEQAGHGIGSTKAQTDALVADTIAFIKWHSGEAGWQPTIAVR